MALEGNLVKNRWSMQFKIMVRFIMRRAIIYVHYK